VLAGVLYLDRLEPESPSRLVFVFSWGAGAAALIGLTGALTGTQLITMPPLRPGGFAAATITATVGAPVVEETLKGAVLAGLLWLRREELDGAHDGVVYASMVGLGFALIENIYYYTQAIHYGFGSVAATFAERGVAAPVCQSLFSSMIGVGVAYAAMSRTGRRLWAVAAGWIAAVALHALWNDSLAAGTGRLAAAYAVLASVLLVLLLAVAVDRRRIVALIVRYLPAHAPAGVATPHDVAMLSSMRDRRQARHWARLHGGLAGMRTATSDLLAGLNDRPRPPWAAGGTSCFAPSATRPGRRASGPETRPG
jgi:RsiW-degrading membrane proteinase PrsW (M82 family)